MSCAALAAMPAHAKLAQTFVLEGSFVLLTRRAELVERQYSDWRPGFGIACNYLLSPLKYLGAGARLSYARERSVEQRDVVLNTLGMCALARPRYPFDTKVATAVFAQVSPGVYRIVGKDVGDLIMIEETYFALEVGGGIAIGSVEFGALYNMAMDKKYDREPRDRNMGWLSIFAGLRLSV